MIVLQLGALTVTLPTTEDAVRFVELIGLAGRYPLPEIEAAPPVAAPARALPPPRPMPAPRPARLDVAVSDEPAPKTVPSLERPPAVPRVSVDEIDERILDAFRANPRRPLHDLAPELFQGHLGANAVRLLKLRLVQLEGQGRLHRVGAAEVRVGPNPKLGRKRGRPPTGTTYKPEHSFDDEEEDPADADDRADLAFDRLDAL
jgi:hypothetical protein